jgi:hypothetical protein
MWRGTVAAKDVQESEAIDGYRFPRGAGCLLWRFEYWEKRGVEGKGEEKRDVTVDCLIDCFG